MHTHSLDQWQHSHAFLGRRHRRNERQTWLVVGLTAATMVLEIIGGYAYGSMAVVADGWHMATHVAALTIVALAYGIARRRVDDPRLSFGTGKIGELAGYSSAIILVLVALAIAYESVERLLNPVSIGFSHALLIAGVGLAVNLASAWLLHDRGGGGHASHGHDHGHDHHHAHDHNHRAAYLHVLTDAATSVLAIVALLGAALFGLNWLDPAMGLVGAVVIVTWSWSLIRSSGSVLIDANPDPHLAQLIRERLERGTDRVSDLHLWRLGPGHAALVVSIVSDHPREPEIYKAKLQGIGLLSHITVEVNRCRDHAQRAGAA
jgi:cation diffusion facilitator family transporter